LIFQNWLSIALALLINVILLGGQWFFSKGRWLGSGDIFYSIGMAVLLGWQKDLLGIFISYLIGSIIAIILLVSKKADRQTAVPFTPFLILGTLIAFYFGQDLINWYIGIFNY
jgi:leader peptidase (prepilin peptidase)/N-methyltransferase